MKRKTIWIAAAVCAVLLCGCSQGEKPQDWTDYSTSAFSADNSTQEQGRNRPGSDSSLSFSEGKPTSPEPAENETETSESRASEPRTPSATESPAPSAQERSPQTGQTTAETGGPVQQPQRTAEPDPPQVPEIQSTAPAAPLTPEETKSSPPSQPEETPAPTQPPAPAFDVSGYVSFARSYGQSIGLSLDSTATACWDDPLTANSGCAYLERDLKDRLDWYAASGFTAFCVWAEDTGGGNYLIYIGYA